MSISEAVIEAINKGRSGENKGLGMGMPKLESVVDGVMSGTYTIIAGGTSTGKTSLALYSYIYKPIMENIDNEDFHIIYFSLEMKAEALFTKLLSIYIYETFGKEISYKELLSRGRDHKLSDEDYELVLQSKPWLDRIEQIIKVYDKKLTADIMYAEIVERLKKYGEFVETENRKLYIPNKKNQIILVVIDHLGLIRSTKGRSKKEEMDLASSYLVSLRNRCDISPLVLMQFNRNSSSVDRRKNSWSEPELQDLKDTSNASEDADVVICIYHPYREKVNNYRGYKVSELQNNFRGLVIRKNRYGDNDLAICSGFYGKSGIWKELPRAEEIEDYTPYKHLSTNPEELEELTKHNKEIIKEKKKIKPSTFNFVMT